MEGIRGHWAGGFRARQGLLSTGDVRLSGKALTDDKAVAFNTELGGAINRYGLAAGDDGFVYLFYCGAWSP